MKAKKMIKQLIVGYLLMTSLLSSSFANNDKPDRKSDAINEVQIINKTSCCTREPNAKDQSLKNNNQTRSVKVTIKTSWIDNNGNSKNKIEAFVLSAGEERKLGCTSNCLDPLGSYTSNVYTREIISANYEK
ncbi:MAG: hypothetical protein ACXVC6_01595 [Bacteroidia bacterium]